jgi:putative phosphoesterase
MSQSKQKEVGLISDIHGNFPALLAVMDALDAREVDQIFCLGDTAGYYPQVNECINLLRERNISSVMGNHDWYLASGNCLRSRMVNLCIEYQRTVVTLQNLKWLKSLPIEIEEYGVRMVHGGWSDPLDEYLEPTENYFRPLQGNYFASGHSHFPQIFSSNGKVWCNPGSVGQPRDSDPRASFAIFNGSSFEIHRVRYDIEETILKSIEAGLPSKVYGGLHIGSRSLIEGSNQG